MTTDPQTTRYRHRTTDVEAVQWTGNNTDQMHAFCGRDFDGMDPMEPGDWVVKTDEDFLVFSPVDFATYYEPAVPVVRPELRDQIATTVEDFFEAWRTGLGDVRPQDALTDAIVAVLPPPADRAVLSIGQREMLSYALDLVEQRDFSRSGRLTDDDRIALAELRRMAVEAQQQTEPGGRDALLQAHAALAEQTGRDQAALARVAAVLDEYEGTDWSYTFPAQRIREAVPAVTSAVAGEERAPRSDVGTEFVHQTDNPAQAALDLWETDLAQSGVSTPGCDCGHDGMGVRWHDTACAWKVGLVAEARAVVSQPGKEN